jgi:elongation factor Ts
MTEITSSLIKELRDNTGAGIMDCKEALREANGSIEAAIDVLRKKGLKNLDKRSSKVTAEGIVGVYQHPGDQISVMVELNCETDFVARGEEFRELARGIGMHIAALNPIYLNESDVPQEVLKKEEEIALEQLNEKQRASADKIIEGKISKFLDENVLVRQFYVKNEERKIQDVLNELSMKVGEKVAIRRFVRFQVGEGVVKEQADLSKDVAELTGSI